MKVMSKKMFAMLNSEDKFAMRTAQLSALLHTISGAGQEHFNEMSQEVQGNLLWLASSLADELDAIARPGIRYTGPTPRNLDL
jgi:hypothetical protein